MSLVEYDIALEDLAASEAELRERVASLEADVVAYRELAQAAIQGWHEVTMDRDRLRASHHRLLDELRFIRRTEMRKAIERAA